MINQMIDQQAERAAKRARVDEAEAILAANDGNNRLRLRALDRGAQPNPEPYTGVPLS